MNSIYCHLLKTGDLQSNRKGSILIGLIVTMVIFALMASAMVSMYGASAMGQVTANNAALAYYLGESGYRYGSGEYVHTGDGDGDDEIQDDRNLKLENLHTEGDLTLDDNRGKFSIKIYPYFLVASGDHALGSTGITTKLPGETPPENFSVPTSGKVKIGDYYYSYSSYDSSTGTLTVSPALLRDLDDYMAINFADNSTKTIQLARGGSLTLSGGTMFPEKNGTVTIDGIANTYRYRSRTGSTLDYITDRDDPENGFSFQVSPSDTIALDPFFELLSSGTIGLGLEATTREISYHVPIPTEHTVEFKESFDDTSLTNWEISTLGTHAVETVEGDSALRVKTTTSAVDAPKVSLIAFTPSPETVDFASVHDSSGYYLSYDAQVKVGFVGDTTPTEGFDPYPIPKYFAAGISFRLDRYDIDGNYYGISFLRGDTNADETKDNIPNEIVPLDEKSTIVLWEQTNNGASRKWLAYKDLSKDPEAQMEDKVESGVGGWTATGLWHISSRRDHSDTHSWYYGREDIGTYNTGAANSGTLTSAPIDLCSVTSAEFSFETYHKTEQHLSYDIRCIDISTDDGDNWSSIGCLERWDDTDFKTPRKYDISSYTGNIVRVRFRFDTLDNLYNDYEGWYVDDIKIKSDDFPVDGATLMLRAKEAASITFTNGFSAVTLQNGDKVTQVSSGASANIYDLPVVESGSFAAGDAAGTLMLRNVSGSFQTGPATVVGGTATVTGFRSKDNFIKVYYGKAADCGTPPDGSLLDDQKYGIGRGDLQWPPDSASEWESVNDYFTLVQWDAVAGGVSLLSTGDEPDAMVRSDTLTSPDSDVYSQPELGLHTLGHGSTNVYFDDFAVKTKTIVKKGLPYTLQD